MAIDLRRRLDFVQRAKDFGMEMEIVQEALLWPMENERRGGRIRSNGLPLRRIVGGKRQL